MEAAAGLVAVDMAARRALALPDMVVEEVTAPAGWEKVAVEVAEREAVVVAERAVVARAVAVAAARGAVMVEVTAMETVREALAREVAAEKVLAASVWAVCRTVVTAFAAVVEH